MIRAIHINLSLCRYQEVTGVYLSIIFFFNDVSSVHFQCVSKENVCDLFSHCLDNSDESQCTPDDVSLLETREPPGAVELDGRGSFTIKKLTGWSGYC